MVRWICIFVSGAFGRGNESLIGFTEGSKAVVALEVCTADMGLKLRWWGAGIGHGFKCSRRFLGRPATAEFGRASFEAGVAGLG